MKRTRRARNAPLRKSKLSASQEEGLVLGEGFDIGGSSGESIIAVCG